MAQACQDMNINVSSQQYAYRQTAGSWPRYRTLKTDQVIRYDQLDKGFILRASCPEVANKIKRVIKKGLAQQKAPVAEEEGEKKEEPAAGEKISKKEAKGDLDGKSTQEKKESKKKEGGGEEGGKEGKAKKDKKKKKDKKDRDE